MIAAAEQVLGGRTQGMIKVRSVKAQELRQSVFGIFPLGILAVADLYARVSAFLSSGKGATGLGQERQHRVHTSLLTPTETIILPSALTVC